MILKLSEKLKQNHESGDFGEVLEGFSELAEKMEAIVEAVAHIGMDWGYGSFELSEDHIKSAREIYESNAENQALTRERQ